MPTGRKYAEDIQPFIDHTAKVGVLKGNRAAGAQKAKPTTKKKLENLGNGGGIFFWDGHDWYSIGPDRSWAEQGACAPHNNGMQSVYKLFYPDPESPLRWRRNLADPACLDWCNRCPVAKQCLDYGRQINAREGVWGGVDMGSERYHKMLDKEERMRAARRKP